MNGQQRRGFIFLGISEDQNHKIDLTQGFQLNFNASSPFRISDIEKAKPKQKNIIITSMDDYKERVLNYLKSNIVGCKPDHIEKIIDFRQVNDDKNGDNFVVIVEVNQSDYRPLQFRQDLRFYMRYKESEPGKGDAESRSMLAEELGHEQQEKYKRMITIDPQMAAYHHQAIPAIPELASLFDFIYYGDRESFDRCLNTFPTIVQINDSFGNNALHIAIIYNRFAMARELIDTHAMSLYQSNKDGKTPLFSAIYAGNLELVQFLLKTDKHLIRHRDRSGNNAILLAALYGHINIVDWFLTDEANELDKSELNLSSRNNEGWNALFNAVYSNKFEMVRFLISKRPNLLDEKDRLNKTIMEVAEFYGCSRQIKDFLAEKLPSKALVTLGCMNNHTSSSSGTPNDMGDVLKRKASRPRPANHKSGEQ